MTSWITKPVRLFTGEAQDENFRRMASIYPVRVVRRSSQATPLPAGQPVELPETFTVGEAMLNTRDFLAEVDTTGLLILKDGKVVFEDYWLGYDATTKSVSWSVAKSFVSALMGIAIAEGRVGSVEDQVTVYAPELAGSAYDGARLKDVLQMSSGARWNEDYSDPDSDIATFGRTLSSGESMDAFSARCVREHPPGTFNRYNTTDTNVLGQVLRNAIGGSLAEYLRDKLWEPIGAEADAFWIVDREGAEFAGGGLNAVLRDYARLGQLYLNNGVWNGVQIVPADWVKASVTPDAPHVMPGQRASSDSPSGYGYQWWVPDLSGAYTAIGIYNQYVFVDPAAGLVIAKISAFRDYARTQGHYRALEHFALFTALAAATTEWGSH